MTVFDIPVDDANDIFKQGRSILVNGSRALEINVTGNLTIGSKLDLSGVSLKDTSSKPTYLGGFALKSSNCCYVGK